MSFKIPEGPVLGDSKKKTNKDFILVTGFVPSTRVKIGSSVAFKFVSEVS